MATTKYGSKTTKAYEQLRKLITSGHFSEGERLSESKAAKLLGMTRRPVRESLRRLESEGLVKHNGQRRSRVVGFTEDVTREELLYRYELREQIEGGAVRLAAMNMTGWQIGYLRSLADEMERCQAAGDMKGSFGPSGEYLKYLLANCGNPLFQQVWDAHNLTPARPRSRWFEQMVFACIPPEELAKPTRVDVVEAVATHDGDRAEQCTKQIVRRITKAIRKVTSWKEGEDAIECAPRDEGKTYREMTNAESQRNHNRL